MRLFTFGLNHATAPLAVRERVAIPPEQLGATLGALTGAFRSAVPHAVVLSTCNRTEVYAVTEESDAALPALRADLAGWFAERRQTAPALLDPHWYFHVDDQALRHACRVASGLDSMVLGEPQILGQMKEAAREADAVGTLGTPLRQAFDRSFAVAKTVRSSTAIGAASVSMAAAAVRLSERIFDDLSKQRIVFIGAGEMIELVATHFAARKPAEIAIANRTLERGQRLAEKLSATGVAAHAMLLSELPQDLAKFDIVISSTASTLPLVGLGMVERALKLRKRRPMFMVDLGVPRDIEREVGELSDVYLYTVDDLGQVVSSGVAQRQAAVGEAEAIIDREVANFMRWLEGRDKVPAIRELHQRGDAFRTVELDRARRRLAKGDDPNAVIEALAFGITNKFLHGPTQLLHDAPDDVRAHLLEYLPRLFGTKKDPKDGDA
jgi:glutamyl-tRNA reductase